MQESDSDGENQRQHEAFKSRKHVVPTFAAEDLVARECTAVELRIVQDWIDSAREAHWEQILALFTNFLEGSPRLDFSRETLLKVFDQYDVDKNGYLDKKAIEEIVLDSLDYALEEQTALLLKMAECYAPPSAAADPDFRENLRTWYRDVIAVKLNTEFDSIANDFWTLIDNNLDKRIAESEFLDRFRQAHQRVLGVRERSTSKEWDADGWKPGDNHKRFKHYFKGASGLRDPQAMYLLALCYAGEAGYAEETRKFNVEDDELIHPDDLVRVPLRTCQQQEYSWLKESAAAGYPPAQQRLALQYMLMKPPRQLIEMDVRMAREEGTFEPVQPPPGEKFISSARQFAYRQAFRLLTAASKGGEYRCTFQLARLYLYGIGCQQSYRNALHCFELSSTQRKSVESMSQLAGLGDENAVYWLGLHALLGSDFSSDDKVKAATHFKKAADMGHPAALHGIGMLYYVGIHKDVPANVELGIKFWHQAADGGCEAAMVSLSRLRNNAAGDDPLVNTEGGELQPMLVGDKNEDRSCCTVCTLS